VSAALVAIAIRSTISGRFVTMSMKADMLVETSLSLFISVSAAAAAKNGIRREREISRFTIPTMSGQKIEAALAIDGYPFG